METSKRLVEALESLDVERVFGYPGGRVIELFDHLPESDVDLVRPRDEREASVMAEMHGRLTGDPGILAGQGPWVGSLGAIGQMEARLASSPMIAITEASERGTYSTVAPYQQARGDYGGLDLPKILDAITKEHWFPRSPTETVRSFQLAFKHAVAGNGIHAAQPYDELSAVADNYEAAVATSYLGKSTIAETHPLATGVIGSFGHAGANQIVSEADVLLVVGCRLNPMDTNWQAPAFIRPDEQTIIHADIDTRNAGWVYPADIGLIGDAAESLRALTKVGGAENTWAKERAAEARTALARRNVNLTRRLSSPSGRSRKSRL